MKAIKETEKAVMLKLTAELPHIEKTVSREIWIPKSLIKDGVIKSWFISKKADEVFGGREVWDLSVTDANGENVEIEVTEESRKMIRDFQKLMKIA